jgi:hypothetical protein
MSADLVERLRAWGDNPDWDPDVLMAEAAAEIERLRPFEARVSEHEAMIQRQRTALEMVALDAKDHQPNDERPTILYASTLGAVRLVLVQKGPRA